MIVGGFLFGAGLVMILDVLGNVWSWDKAVRLTYIESFIIFCGGVSGVRCKLPYIQN